MNPQENLDRLFERARNVDPLFELDEVKQIIAKPKPSNKLKAKANHTTKIWLIGAATIIVVCGAIYFVMSDENAPQNKEQVTSLTEDTIINLEDQEVKIIAETELPMTNEQKNKSQVVDNDDRTETAHNSDLIMGKRKVPELKFTETAQYPAASSVIYPESSKVEFSDDYIHLTNEELAKLGIITDGNTLKYIRQTDTTKLSDDSREIPLAYAYNIEIEKFGSVRTSNVHKCDSLLIHNSCTAMPLIVYLDNGKCNSRDNFVGDHHIPEEFKDKYVSEMKQNLVPVMVLTKAKLNIYGHDRELVFWFKNNEAFRNALPSEMRNEIRNSYPEFNENEYREYVNGLIKLKKINDDRYTISVEKKAEVRNRLITLSKQDLKKIHIRFDGKKLVYRQIYKSNKGKYMRHKLTVTPHVFYADVVGQVPGIFSIGLDDYHAWYTTDTSLNMIHNLIDRAGESKDGNMYFENLRTNNKRFIERIDSMVPVLILFDKNVIAKSKEQNVLTSQILWFPLENKSFLNALPDEARNKALLSKKNSVEKFQGWSVNVKRIKILELDKDNLTKLGVTTSQTSIKLPFTINRNSNIHMVKFSDGGSSATFFTLTSDEYYNLPVNERGDSSMIMPSSEAANGKYMFFPKLEANYILPVFVTDENGKHTFMYNDVSKYPLHDSDLGYMKKYDIDTEAYYFTNRYRDYVKRFTRSRMQTFVPILVKSNDSHLKMILWYEPSDSFFATLPKNVADEIKSEYMAIKASQPTPSCKYFEVCQSVKGMINDYAAYPNPTTDELNVMIDLAEERKLTISLTEITGKEAKNFVSNIIQQKGKKDYPFHIGDLNDGMYILRIESDKGESVTQRIIKK